MTLARPDRRADCPAGSSSGTPGGPAGTKDAPGCRVVKVEGVSGRLRGQTARKDDHRGTLYGSPSSPNHSAVAEGLLRYAWCRTDSDGSDSGRIGCADVGLNAILFRLAPK